MSERELLELAAKAAGMNVFTGEWPENEDGWFFCVQHGVPGMHFAPKDNRAHSIGPWNPLTDDGDALRLAVKLGAFAGTFYVMGYSSASIPFADSEAYACVYHHDHNGDASAALRLAIVTAAAELGRSQ